MTVGLCISWVLVYCCYSHSTRNDNKPVADVALSRRAMLRSSCRGQTHGQMDGQMDKICATIRACAWLSLRVASQLSCISQ